MTVGEATAAQGYGSTNCNAKVSNYTYTRTGVNSAVLTVQTIAPPPNAGSAPSGASDSQDTLFLSFKSGTTVNFTNLNGDYGTMVLQGAAPATAPATLSGRTIKFISF